MKKEVTVCDIPSDHGDECRHLADYVCPLCRRDVCSDHRTTGLSVEIRLFWPQRSQSGGSPPRDEFAGAQVKSIGICHACYYSVRGVPIHSVAQLVGQTVQKAVEAYGADLATAQLKHGRAASDDD